MNEPFKRIAYDVISEELSCMRAVVDEIDLKRFDFKSGVVRNSAQDA